MRTVTTVTGEIPAGELGVVLPAEHIRADHAVPGDLADTWRRAGRRRPVAATDRARYEAPLGMGMLGDVNMGAVRNRDNERIDDTGLAVRELRRFREFGGGAVVDITAIDAGRDPHELRRISGLSGVRIVMATGWRSPRWAPEIAELRAGEIADRLVRDVVDGVPGPVAVRAGVIAQYGALDPGEAVDLRLLGACADAAVRTGAPLMIGHPRRAEDAVRVIGIVLERGVDPSRLCVLGATAYARDLDHLVALAGLGIALGFDTVGRIPTVYTSVSDHDAALAILALAAGDARERLLVSPRIRRKVDLMGYGGTGYAFVQEQLLPYLSGLGADDSLAAQLTVANPARFLGTDLSTPETRS